MSIIEKMKSPALEIILATCNGERFVEEQIRSLQKQTFEDWRLLVHDDGSTDSTPKIVGRLASEDPRIKVLNDGITKGSAVANFLHLLAHSTADRVIFCDQDDIWFPDKIELMMKRGEELREDRPGVVYSRANYWRAENGIIGETWKRYPANLAQFLGQKAAVQGAAALINGAMRGAMLDYEGPMVMHDYLLALIAYSWGQIIFMPEILMNYRQHDANVTGNNDQGRHGFDWLRSKLNNRPVMDPLTLKTVKSFYATFKGGIPEEKREVFRAFFKMKHQSRLGRAYSAMKYGFARDGSVPKLAVKLLLSPYLKQ